MSEPALQSGSHRTFLSMLTENSYTLIHLDFSVTSKITFWPQHLIHQHNNTADRHEAIFVLPRGPTLSLPHLIFNTVMINHPTSNRSALLPHHSRPLPWNPDDCLMLGHETMGSRCVIDGVWTMLISVKALWFRVTDIPLHPLARHAFWLQG